ncbi:ubiquitin carboxyl-terminal hydrolase [Shewanella sp. 202IG2-18]|uniref:ubiquitin carboxyl-terminal hydrolase n=1 Tax=Parashewanella hymeniacidonis TaxID=2807618 RepID=UPI001960BA5D|nr:ubiquitin carboxyl-terminal hydrolase family protein [Parashewanella hymeniacidonis]MBM7071759.1 ubiquitin carboxyl-terminal hydrolase [Parashewanella hymeniacidonis]
MSVEVSGRLYWNPDTLEVLIPSEVTVKSLIPALEVGQTKEVKFEFHNDKSKRFEVRTYRVTRKDAETFDFNRVGGVRSFLNLFNFFKLRSAQSKAISKFFNGDTTVAEKLPGFENKNQTCFMNAALKQIIIDNPQKITDKVTENTRNKPEAHKNLAIAFARLSDACHDFKSGQITKGRVDRLFDEFYHQLQAFAKQDLTLTSERNDQDFITCMKRMFVTEANRQHDPNEFGQFIYHITGLRDKENELRLCRKMVRQSNTSDIDYKTDSNPPTYYPIDLAGNGNLVDKFSHESSESYSRKDPDWGETDRFSRIGCNNPSTLTTIRLQAKVTGLDDFGDSFKRTSEARALIPKQDVFELELFNNTTKKVDKCKFKIKAVVVHSGSDSKSGHYYTLERGANDSWIKHNDNRVTHLKTDLHDHFRRNKTAVPHLITLERV